MAVPVVVPLGALSRRVTGTRSAGLVVNSVGDSETTEPTDEQCGRRDQDRQAAGAAHAASTRIPTHDPTAANRVRPPGHLVPDSILTCETGRVG